DVVADDGDTAGGEGDPVSGGVDQSQGPERRAGRAGVELEAGPAVVVDLDHRRRPEARGGGAVDVYRVRHGGEGAARQADLPGHAEADEVGAGGVVGIEQGLAQRAGAGVAQVGHDEGGGQVTLLERLKKWTEAAETGIGRKASFPE